MKVFSKAALFLFAILSLGAVAKSNEVQGTYRFEVQERANDNSVVVKLRVEGSSKSPENLLFISQHIHPSVATGVVKKIYGTLTGQSSSEGLHLSQLMIWVQTQEGRSPVWMVSSEYPPKRISGSKYLKMHSPGSDYRIF
ncbi:MAG: hypothetical protein HRU19_07690 [Pseudobacteriovorax sp.]|nr:hypothetical protein [Pseudobacteriovorax sp.]